MTARDDCESCGATSADKCVCGVHSCSYECDRPACVRRQRDELRAHLYALYDKKVALPEPDFIGVSKDGMPQGKCYSLIQLESYAAARVAEATAKLSSALEELDETDKDIAVAQAVEFAQYVVDHAKGRMVEAAERFLSLAYSQEIATRLKAL